MRIVVELLITMMLVVTVADLLYLYYRGVWYDPNKAIEVAEVALLYIFMAGGLSYFVWRVRAELRRKR